MILAACLAGPSLAAGEEASRPATVRTVPAAPTEPVEAEVYRVLDGHCAGCHQTGALESLRPAGGFGNVLALDELAREPHLVQAGNPDGSRLLAYLLESRHPRRIAEKPEARPRPSAAGIAAVHEWIDRLRRSGASCQGRGRLAPRDVTRAIETWLAVFGLKITRDTRFVTLAHLHNECASEREWQGYREAVDKLLNSLSSHEGPVRTRALDGTGAILAVRLGDLGWDASRWDTLAEAQPRGLVPEVTSAIVHATGARQPVVRADWLADAGSRPPLYYDLLNVPGQLQDFARLIGIGPETAPNQTRIVRAAVRASRVTGGPRSAERHEAPSGPVWFARDYLAAPEGHGGREHVSKLDAPAETGSTTWPHGTRAIVTLPNGFLGFAIFAAEGRRRERIAIDLDRSLIGDFGPTYAGRSCLGCHASGVIPFAGEKPANARSEPSKALSEAPTAGLATFPAAPDLGELFAADTHRYRSAMIRAGIDPDRTLHGLEVINGLARRYRADVGLGRAAAEFGIDAESFSRQLLALSGDDALLAVRLRQGLLTRAEANVLLARLASADHDGEALAPSPPRDRGRAPARDGTDAIRLLLWSDKVDYKIGDRPRFEIETSVPCHLTLVSVNPRGTGTVLFPNDFEPDNRIVPGQKIQFPGASSPYDLRFTETGRETVVAICDTRAEPPLGIRHRYAQQRFTILGNWRGFLASGEVSGSGKTASRRRRLAKNAAETPSPDTDPGLSAGRTAIVIEVRD